MWQGNIIGESVAQSEMKPDEKLLWSGQPRKGIRMRPSDALLIPFSLMWGGFALFWEAGVISSGAPVFFRLWGIPFVLIGIYMIVGRFFFDAATRARTHYAVTDQRILIISDVMGRKVQSLSLRTLPEITLDRKVDGSGTLTFGSTSSRNAWGNSSWPGMQNQRVPSFDFIENAKDVSDIIQTAQHQLR